LRVQHPNSKQGAKYCHGNSLGLAQRIISHRTVFSIWYMERPGVARLLLNIRSREGLVCRFLESTILPASAQGPRVRGNDANDLTRLRIHDSLDASTSISIRSVDRHPL
jgi:hypothetical protein